MNFFVHKVCNLSPNLKWSINFTSRITSPQKLYLSREAAFCLAVNGGCYIQAGNGIYIGEDTIIATGVKIISGNHSIDDFTRYEPMPPIRIGSRCWIATNVVILPGVQLGDNVIVGAGAVVTKSFDSGCVIAGIPAKVIRKNKRNNDKAMSKR